jgi:hypothetical protein
MKNLSGQRKRLRVLLGGVCPAGKYQNPIYITLLKITFFRACELFTNMVPVLFPHCCTTGSTLCMTLVSETEKAELEFPRINETTTLIFWQGYRIKQASSVRFAFL